MLEIIETAIIDLVKAAPLPYKLTTVASYGGEFDDELETVVRSFPAVWVTFSGSAKPERTGNRTWRVPCTFSVLCGVRSPRDEQATRYGLKVAGQIREVGVYQMLLDVRNLLLNSDLGLSITPFMPGVVRTLYNTRLRAEALAVFGQEWHTSFVLHQDTPPVLPAGMLNTVGMTYLGEPGSKPMLSDQLTTR